MKTVKLALCFVPHSGEFAADTFIYTPLGGRPSAPAGPKRIPVPGKGPWLGSWPPSTTSASSCLFRRSAFTRQATASIPASSRSIWQHELRTLHPLVEGRGSQNHASDGSDKIKPRGRPRLRFCRADPAGVPPDARRRKLDRRTRSANARPILADGLEIYRRQGNRGCSRALSARRKFRRDGAPTAVPVPLAHEWTPLTVHALSVAPAILIQDRL